VQKTCDSAAIVDQGRVVVQGSIADGGHRRSFALAGRAVVGRRDRPEGISHPFG
jgi:hypothetical protein